MDGEKPIKFLSKHMKFFMFVCFILINKPKQTELQLKIANFSSEIRLQYLSRINQKWFTTFSTDFDEI